MGLSGKGALPPAARGATTNSHCTVFFKGLDSGTSRTVVLGRGTVVLVDFIYSVDTD